MDELKKKYRAQIEALRAELAKKDAYIAKQNEFIRELHDGMVQCQMDSLCATSGAYDGILGV